jgi:hypothetical protein
MKLAREALHFFWRYPDRMIAAVFHDWFGDPEKSKRIIQEMREADRER